jgi:hypothetical protein
MSRPYQKYSPEFRLPTARHHVLAGLAHQPYLESASTVAQLIRSAVTEG